jgi:hypothetical protein
VPLFMDAFSSRGLRTARGKRRCSEVFVVGRLDNVTATIRRLDPDADAPDHEEREERDEDVEAEVLILNSLRA